MLVGDVVTDFRNEVLDQTPTTWLDAAVLQFLNSILAAAVGLKKDLVPYQATIPLVAGSVQSLTQATGLTAANFSSLVQCIEPLYNTASLNGLNKAGMLLLNRRIPGWRTITPTVDATDIMFDQRDPARFHCYPPNTNTGSIQMICGAVPYFVSSLSGLIPLSASVVVIPVLDNYRQAIVDGLCSKALSAQTRRQDIVKANLFWQKFQAGIRGVQVALGEAAPELADKAEA